MFISCLVPWLSQTLLAESFGITAAVQQAMDLVGPWDRVVLWGSRGGTGGNEGLRIC